MFIHRVFHKEVTSLFLMSLFGIFATDFNARAELGSSQDMILEEGQGRQPSAEELSGPPNGQGGWVIVEPTYILPTEAGQKSSLDLASYRDRRKNWGYHLSLGYSMFAPTNYEPTLGPFVQFTDLYSESADSPLVEFQYNLKRNLSFASLGVEFAAGLYSNQSKVDGVDSTLEITMYRLGFSLILDTLFAEPWVAPYGSVGGYVIQKRESLASVTENESTQLAPYVSVGLLLQLDWIDEQTALVAFTDMGIENTFLFVEGRKMIESSNEADSNFSTDIYATAGLRIEL